MGAPGNVRALDLGISFGSYALSVAAAIKSSKIQGYVELVESAAEDLGKSLRRCNIDVQLKSIFDLHSPEDVESYLDNLLQDTTDRISKQMGVRQLKLFLFGLSLNQAIGGKLFGYDYSVNVSKMFELGPDIGLEQTDIARWLDGPDYSNIVNEVHAKIQYLEEGEDKRMDITPFIPVIVEATKFVFTEVSKWISDVRRRAGQESGPPVGSTLPITQEQLSSIIEANAGGVVRLLNEFVTQADITEISNLLDQLKIRRALFLELEAQEITAAGAEAAKLRVNIQNEAREIIKTIERLEKALARVYQLG